MLTVADLHRSAALLDALREAVVQHKPDVVALVGDFLHGFDDNRYRVSVLGCAKLLSQLPGPEIVFVRGNHEDDAWFLFAAKHDHITPIRSICWHHRIGQTTCVNVGQTDHGPLHYCLVEAAFESQSPSLPARMQVTAFPWQETLALPSGEVTTRWGGKDIR